MSINLNADSLCLAPYMRLAAERGFEHFASAGFPAVAEEEVAIGGAGGEIVATWRRPGRRYHHVLLFDDAVALLLQDAAMVIQTAAATAGRATELAGAIEAAIRPAPADDGRVPVAYWTMTRHAPAVSRRRLHVPAWADICGNYPSDISGSLTDLMKTEALPTDGRLLLWHGPPGTGKTTALRALASAWRDWCVLQYVTDPEELFGRGAHYLTEVLLGNEPRAGGRDLARLIVLEDAGELMSLTARSESGQGLSRLLNLCDGMLGQGIDVAVLISTNEPISRLHPAVTRPGRLWSQLEFDPFPAPDANAWLRDRGSDLRVDGARPLAELYAMLRDEPVIRPSAAVGFAS